MGKYLIFSSSVGLARDLIKELKSNKRRAPRSARRPFSRPMGPSWPRLLEINRTRLAMQLMLGRGETKEKAESQVELGLALLRYLGHGRLVIRDDPAATRIQLKFQLAK